MIQKGTEAHFDKHNFLLLACVFTNILCRWLNGSTVDPQVEQRNGIP